MRVGKGADITVKTLSRRGWFPFYTFPSLKGTLFNLLRGCLGFLIEASIWQLSADSLPSRR